MHSEVWFANSTYALGLASKQILMQYCLYWFPVPSHVTENDELLSHELLQLLLFSHLRIAALIVVRIGGIEMDNVNI